MKKEQIEEMARIAQRGIDEQTDRCPYPDCQHKHSDVSCDVCEAPTPFTTQATASRKSVWSTSVMFDVPAQKITGYTHICQSCFYLYKDKKPQGDKFCPNCGAKMKGGAE